MKFTKENLYNEIRKYIYDSTFGDLNVFSKQYYHCIVSPCFSDNEKNEPYSVISIDFNNMQEINKFGIKRGDEILHDSIELMQSVLPENSYTIRLGGDEFLFLLNNASKEEVRSIEKQMHEKLKEASDLINGTTVTSYSTDSKLANNIDSLIEFADAAITAKKQNAKTSDSLDNWDILEQKAKDNFSSFFKTLRFHNFPLDTEHMQRILESATNTYDNFIENPDANKEENIDSLENGVNNTIYSIEDLKSLHHLLADSKDGVINQSLLDNVEIDTLANILNSMVRDPITMQFAEPYFKRFLLDECNDKFKVLKISPVFVKLSNTLNSSHHLTNKQIENKQRKLYNYLNNKIDFNQDTYTNTPLNYMVSLSGGDMLLALDPKTKLKVKDIKSFLESNYSTEYSQDNLLRYVAADKFSKLSKNNFSKVFFDQTDQCNENKIPLIDSLINDDIIQDLLDISLKDTMNFYNQIVPDVNDITAKQKYMNMIGKTVLDLYSTLDVERDEKMIQEKKQSFFSKTRNTFSSIFRKRVKSLPEQTLENKEQVSNFSDGNKTSKSNFVSKVNIDYSKINHLSKSEEEIENEIKEIDEGENIK